MANMTSEEVKETAEGNVESLLEYVEGFFEPFGDTAEKDKREVLEDYIRINSMQNIIIQTMLDLDKPTQH